MYVLMVTTKWQNDSAATWPIVPFQVSAVQKVIKSGLILPETFTTFIHIQILNLLFVPCLENSCSCSSFNLECLNVSQCWGKAMSSSLRWVGLAVGSLNLFWVYYYISVEIVVFEMRGPKKIKKNKITNKGAPETNVVCKQQAFYDWSLSLRRLWNSL